MTSTKTHVLADYLTPERSSILSMMLVVGFALLTALLAQIRIPVPGSPVPLTGQTFAVLLSGAVLGGRRAFSSQALYLAAGAMGLPVFAGGAFSFAYLMGPTGGYLWSYPLAAALMGWLVERGASRTPFLLAPSLIGCDAVILTCGALWLHFIFGIEYRQAALLGFYPFLVGDILKIVLVGLTLPRVMTWSSPRGSK
jgi:biotin transport system substrate-specific component